MSNISSEITDGLLRVEMVELFCCYYCYWHLHSCFNGERHKAQSSVNSPVSRGAVCRKAHWTREAPANRTRDRTVPVSPRATGWRWRASSASFIPHFIFHWTVNRPKHGYNEEGSGGLTRKTDEKQSQREKSWKIKERESYSCTWI